MNGWRLKLRFLLGITGIFALGLAGCKSVKEDINLDMDIVEEKADTDINNIDTINIDNNEFENNIKNNIDDKEDDMMMNNGLESKFNNIEYTKSYKSHLNNNPLITQDFGADPWALVYKDRVYVYMTHDILMHNQEGEVVDNTYGNINKLKVISSSDLVNWTDHGDIHVGGLNGASKWANCSWAPAVAWREIDGEDKFFIYFSNSGSGIGVLTADSPIGPFRDEIGKPLIDRNTPNVKDVVWIFDPAVLVDDDGKAYLYFGGGLPEGQYEYPNTARVIELGPDMMSTVGEANVIEAPYMFESSGINKIGDTYFYSYCSNFISRAGATGEHVPKPGEVITMTSKSPVGPWKYEGSILKNPGYFFGTGGNNHHCMIEFNGRYFMFYHTSVLQDEMGIKGGYRCTFINEAYVEDGKIKPIIGDKLGVKQLMAFNPYQETEAVTMSNNAGIKTYEAEASNASSKVYLGDIDNGDWISVSQVDFGEKGPESLTLSYAASQNNGGAVRISLDSLDGDAIAYVEITDTKGLDNFVEVTVPVSQVTGIHDIYFTFVGSDYQLDYWKFNDKN
ncbi:MAG: family 43 glycosylhydrolase [Clostridiales bacterium]|nr:family 43 glycosylhydrolase [Clostridiales bacterium]